ncbi:MAG: CHAT domain-containing protein, partial [Longimicrobiales bacterium]
SSTILCEDVEITFDEIVLRPPMIPAEPHAVRTAPRMQPVYLIVRRERGGDREFVVRSSLLTAGSKATIVTGSRTVSATAFEKIRTDLVDDETQDFTDAGSRMAQLILADEVVHVLPRFSQNHLVVVHDAFMSRVPWETLCLQDGQKTVMPAATAGVSHLYAAENLSVAKWLEERIEDDVLSMLLVVDPTSDLQGAREEGRAIQRLFAGRTGVRIDLVYQGEATRPALLEAFGSGRYDVVHYAGHAEFDEAQRERSGIVCADGTILSGADLATISRLPTLMFFNACESARLRGRRAARESGDSTARIESNTERIARVERAVGMAEAFLRGGLANFLGTYWPVNDAAATAFAGTLYGALLQGTTMNAAVQQGRAAVRTAQSRDWTNYMFYGNPDFVLKVPSVVRGETVEIDVNAGSDTAE